MAKARDQKADATILRFGLMTAAAQKLSAIAIVTALCLGLTASRLRAQNEPEAAPTRLEAPQAAPTDFTPVTAGDANRGAPATTADASPSSAAAATPESAAASPDATPATSSQAAASENSSSGGIAK